MVHPSPSVHPWDDHRARCLASTQDAQFRHALVRVPPLLSPAHPSDGRLVRCLASIYYALTSDLLEASLQPFVYAGLIGCSSCSIASPVRLGPSDTLVKHNVLLEYDAYRYGYGYDMGSMLVVSVTHTRLRVSGSYPSSVCLAKLTRAQRMTRPSRRF
jgi:hypothetical protein